MSSQALITAEIVVAACFLGALAFLAGVFVRRRLLARGGDLMMCHLRGTSQSRWAAGLLRFDDTSLGWFPLFGVTLRPRYCWERAGLEVETLRLDAGGSGDPMAVRLAMEGRSPGSVSERRVELAMGRAPYTAMRAWLEASPPGRRPVDW